jgi:hypothetical protein
LRLLFSFYSRRSGLSCWLCVSPAAVLNYVARRRLIELLESRTMENRSMTKRILAGFAVALLAVGVVQVDLVAQPHSEVASKKANAAASDAEREAKLRIMTDAARAAYAGIVENHTLGKATSNNEIYAWSNQIRSCEARAANAPQQVTKACQEHLQRMQILRDRVVALGKQGFPGGEMYRQAATQFYVAEAELLLLEAKANERFQAAPKPRPRD